jgi:hypothetical protein
MNLKIKSHKKRHKYRLIRPQTEHKNPGHKYLKLLTPLTPSVEKTMYLLHGFKEVYKPTDTNLLLSPCGSILHGSTSHQK